MTNAFTPLRKVALYGAWSLLFVAGPSIADIPDNLTDIPNQSTAWGGDQLRMRGYTFINSDYHNGKLHEYWWNGRSDTCIHARADAGRYEMLKVTGATDCNQYHESAAKNDNAAAAAIAAAAILGAVALAHKSHERDEQHGQNERSISEFDRGYRDGLYHEPYHNVKNTRAYTDGYNQGNTQREEQLHHRQTRPGAIPPPRVDINREDDAATVAFRGGCEVLFAPNGAMVKWSSFCTDQEKDAATRAYRAARAEKNAGPGAYNDV